MRSLARALLLLLTVVAALPLRPVAGEASLATWYGPGFDGSVMANGQVYNMHDPTTTASNLYPLGTWLKVKNLQNGREVIVQVKDRGAFHHAVDLSMAAFSLLDDLSLGVLPVDVRPSAAPLPGPRPPAPAGSFAVTVQPGDSLTDLAERYGTTVDTLMYLNGLPTPHYIQIGSTLVIPPNQPGTPPSPNLAAVPPTGATAPKAAPTAAGVSEAAVAPATSAGPAQAAPTSAPTSAAPAAPNSADTAADPTAPTAPGHDFGADPAGAPAPPATAAAGASSPPTTTTLAAATGTTTAAARAAQATAPASVAGNQPPRFVSVTQVDGESVARIDRRPVAGVAAPPDVDYAYLRQEPSTASALLGAIPRGERVEVLGVASGESVSAGENRWWRVRYAGQLGYVWYPLISFE